MRHYWVRACNVFGCAELSDPVALGGGLLGIDEGDNPRAAGDFGCVDFDIHASATDDSMVALTLTDLVKTPTGKISPSVCLSDVVTRVADNGEVITGGGGPRDQF